MKKYIAVFTFVAAAILLLGMHFGYTMRFALVDDPVQITDENADAELIDLGEIHRRYTQRRDRFSEGVFTRTYLQNGYLEESIRITYPQLENTPENREINRIIKEDAVSVLKRYSVDDLEELMLEVDYKISFKSDTLLSIAYFAVSNVGEIITGGQRYNYTLNINLASGEKLFLDTVVADVPGLCDVINRGNFVYRRGDSIDIVTVDLGKLQMCDYKDHSNKVEVCSYFTQDCLGISYGNELQIEIPYEDVLLIKPELFAN